ncbi:hypothetical protein HNQ77_001617 [Silvibacterium bohemicum]|uniref:Uncharacterized protein n=1 Tax=Silvibacterium bohemicum TaxID=1577686 RepID=A0A841JZ08_9BACT|nr:hypothetical protein [Silvibacterium bohemicum]MBB6143668.1 hypothetical protein [Silvibacterium bohemicum]
MTAQSGLSITYGPSGVQRLVYNSVVLEDLAQNPSDAFHIWHMKMTDLSGKVLSEGQYGWGENNDGKSWNSSTNTWTYRFEWGEIQVKFAQKGANLDMTVTEMNRAGSGVILDGAVIYPFALHLPKLPASFGNPSYPQLAFNTTGPSVTVADYGSGQVTAAVPDATSPLYSGFLPAGSGIAYSPIISGTAPDGLAVFQPHNDRTVKPNQTITFTVSLRFAPSGTSAVKVASDVFANWAKAWPATLHWNDRRAIGTVFLASSPAGDPQKAGGFPNNPRRYFDDDTASDFDVRTAAGIAAFQARILQQASDNVANLQKMDAQGAITWDIEGEEYPQSTSYVCEPDNIAQIAPEMETTITDRASPYKGMKLDDAYFKIMTSAGFRVGVCVRPQHFTPGAGGTAQQVYLQDTETFSELLGKMRFAHDRWGATLFYVDSSVEQDGAILDADIFQKLAAALPDSLIMPEEATPKHYGYTAPFLSFIDHGDLGTDPIVRSYYPDAFSVNMVNDVDAEKLAAAESQLVNSVRTGDVLMGHADYWQANDPTIVAMYRSAGTWKPSPADSSH